jgi:hypothetical protein
MVVPNEGMVVDVRQNDSSKPSTLDHPNINSVGDSDSVYLEKPYQPARTVTEDEYPHGLKLVILAGASLIAVFLIALDQVSVPLSLILKPTATSNTERM